MRRAAFPLIAFALSTAAQAAWVGNPAHPREGGGAAAVYDWGERDVTLSGSGGVTESLDSRGFFLEHRSTLSRAFQGSLRLLPFTGRMNLAGASFNPHMAGGGIGLHFSPPEPLGPVRVGAQAVWDGRAGARKRAVAGSDKEYDRVFWSEAMVAVAVSYDVMETWGVYGGPVWNKLDVHFNVGGVRSDWTEEQAWGAFFGGELNPNEAWTVAGEFRLGHERSMALILRYNY